MLFKLGESFALEIIAMRVMKFNIQYYIKIPRLRFCASSPLLVLSFAQFLFLFQLFSSHSLSAGLAYQFGLEHQRFIFEWIK